MSAAAKVFLTSDEAAARARVKKGTLANWRAQRKGPPFSKRGSKVVYPLDKFEAWEAANDNEINHEND